MSDLNTPAIIKVSGSFKESDRLMDLVRPGTWWKLTGSNSDLNAFQAPDHGFILFLKEVRVVDGDFHSVVLGKHPAHPMKDVKILFEDFLSNFTFQADGKELRDLEIEAVMAEISGISETLSAGPAPEEILKITSSAPQKDDVTPARQDLPASLLPSGDVVALQARIERQIAEVSARKTWVEARTADLQAKMGLVSRYQMERVDVTMAGISDQRQAADRLLANVQTMRLFLGEDQSFERLTLGNMAEDSEPVTFMQRMLYLDEELHIHGKLNGFTGDDIKRLPALFAANPGFVQRLLPFEKCVTIARARRSTRPISATGTEFIAEVLHAINSDNRVIVLIRNGDQVSMIETDEITSKAQRLFPSKEEIDAIFKEKSFSGSKVITPQDVEYSEKRLDHDARALFYKRILLILWGLSERESVFGSFIPKGENWLERVSDPSLFRFIHDEENVLSDGKPSLQTYLAANRKTITEGSRVLIQIKTAINEYNASHLYSAGSGSRFLTAAFPRPFHVASVFEKDGAYHVKVPVLKNNGKEGSTTFSIASFEQSWGKYDLQTAYGFVNLDEVTLEDLTYYSEGRQHREHYLEYLALFDEARTILLKEQALDAPCVKKCVEKFGRSHDEIFTAVKAFRRSFGKGPSERDSLKIAEIAARSEDLLSKAVPGSDIHVSAKSSRVITAETGSLFGIAVSVQKIAEYEAGDLAADPVMRKQIYDTRPSSGFVILRSSQNTAAQESARVFPSAVRRESFMAVLEAPAHEELHDYVRSITSKDFDQWEQFLFSTLDWVRSNVDKQGSSRVVVMPEYRITVGFMAKVENNAVSQAFRVSLGIKHDLLALSRGHEDLVKRFYQSIYQNPDKNLDRLKASLACGAHPVVGEFSSIKSVYDPLLDDGINYLDLCAPRYAFKIDASNLQTLHPGDIRETIVTSLMERSSYKVPSTAEEISLEMEKLRFEFIPGRKPLLDLCMTHSSPEQLVLPSDP